MIRLHGMFSSNFDSFDMRQALALETRTLFDVVPGRDSLL